MVQGYAGVGNHPVPGSQSAISRCRETRPRVIGLAPTHRAVGKCRVLAWMRARRRRSSTTRSCCSAMGRHPISATPCSCSTRARWWGWPIWQKPTLIAAGGGRRCPGDTDQLPPIASGQPFRLTQQRSAADVAIMKEIVRQMPELRPAVYSLIERMHRALTTIEQVTPEQVPRKKAHGRRAVLWWNSRQSRKRR